MKFFKVRYKLKNKLNFDDEFAFPLDNVIGKERIENVRQIAGYMRTCTIVAEWLSPTDCPIECGKEMPFVEYSDGSYLWNSVHVHLLQKHGLRLPDEFKHHVNLRLKKRKAYSHFTPDQIQNAYEKSNAIIEEVHERTEEDFDFYSLFEPSDFLIDDNELLEKISVMEKA